MTQPIPRGVRPGDEPRGPLRRDPRRITQQIADGIRSPLGAAISLIAFGLAGLFAPAITHAAPLVIAVVLALHLPYRKSRHLPMRLPIDADIPDLNDPLPGRRKYRKAAGMVYLGNACDYENEELWSGRLDELAHGLTLGTTGAGKTVLLVGRAANYIVLGGGLIYADAKASPSLAWDIASLALRVGREDDLGIINYMTGNRTVSGNSPVRTTNTANPFTSGSADSCVQMLASLIKEPEGDNAVFGERALAMVSALMYALVALRDAGHIDLGVSIIRDNLPLQRLEQIAFDPRIDYRPVARDAVRAYLTSLPNYKPPSERQAKDQRGNLKYAPDGSPILDPIADQAGAQHGFAQMYFTRAMSSMTDTYGHIYFGNLPEIDFVDVVRRRRILVIMLPALEKSPAELSNLGKINLAAIRDAISTGLGSGIEGRRADVLENLPTDSPIASKIICDEYGYMAVEGFSVVAAQARSLGFSVEWAGQDWAGIKRGSEKEAEQIWSNATLKTFGRLEDPEGFQKFSAAAGETRVAQVGGYSMQDMAYRESNELGLEKQQRVDFVDLQRQIEGEVHLYWRGQLLRATTFYAGAAEIGDLRINRYLRVGERTAITAAPAPTVAAAAPGTSGGTSAGGPAAKPVPSRIDPRVPPTRPGTPSRPDLMDAVRSPPPAPPVDAPTPDPVPAVPSPPERPDSRSASPAPRRPAVDLDAALALPPDIPTPPARRSQSDLRSLLMAPGLDTDDDDVPDLPPPLTPPPTAPVAAEAAPEPATDAPPAPTSAPDEAAETSEDVGSWNEVAPLQDLTDRLDLAAILGEGTAGHATLAASIDRTLDSYPDAHLRDVAQDLSHELVSARAEAAMRFLLDETPMDEDEAHPR